MIRTNQTHKNYLGTKPVMAEIIATEGSGYQCGNCGVRSGKQAVMVGGDCGVG
jgi:hypothetical protein